MKRNIFTTCFLLILYSLPWISGAEAGNSLGFFGALPAEHVHEEADNTLEQLKNLEGAISINVAENFTQHGSPLQKGVVGGRNPEDDSVDSTTGCSPTMDAEQKCPPGFVELTKILHQILTLYQSRQSKNCPPGFWYKGCGGNRQEICQMIYTSGDFGAKTLHKKCI